jgi:DNA-binding CsgD family transcriptional regulator
VRHSNDPRGDRMPDPRAEAPSLMSPGRGVTGLDPAICFPGEHGLSVGLHLGSVIAKSPTRDVAIAMTTALLANETRGAVAAWRRAPTALIFVAAEGIDRTARDALLTAASPWTATGRGSLRKLATTFGAFAGAGDPTIVDLDVAVLLLAERCPEVEASRVELAAAIAALPEMEPVIVLGEAAPERTFETEALLRLTPREREILELIASGLGTQQIADALVISAKTVKTHVQNILAKLGVGSRIEAVALLRSRVPSGRK